MKRNQFYSQLVAIVVLMAVVASFLGSLTSATNVPVSSAAPMHIFEGFSYVEKQPINALYGEDATWYNDHSGPLGVGKWCAPQYDGFAIKGTNSGSYYKDNDTKDMTTKCGNPVTKYDDTNVADSGDATSTSTNTNTTATIVAVVPAPVVVAVTIVPTPTVNPIVTVDPTPAPEATCDNANPGNDKCKGNAGEDPNGKGTMILDGIGVHGNQDVHGNGK